MLSGYSTKSEILASLSVTEALLVLLRRKGIVTDGEISQLLTTVADDLGKNPLAEVKGAADLVNTMREEALAS